MKPNVHYSSSFPYMSFGFIKNSADFVTSNQSLGDFYKLSIPFTSIHVCTDPEIFEQVLVKNKTDFRKSKYYWGELRKLVGKSIGSLENTEWEQLRGIEQPFYTPKRAALDAELVFILQNKWIEKLIGTKEKFPLIDFLSVMNISMLLNIIFDVDETELAGMIFNRIKDGQKIIFWRSLFPLNPLIGNFNGKNKAAAQHKEFFRKFANSSANSENKNGKMIHELRKILKENKIPGFPPDLIANEMIVHLGASSETTAVAEGWIIYCLWKNQQCLKKVRTEIETIYGTKAVTTDRLLELNYTIMAIHEGLRLYPPTHALVRDCINDTVLSNGVEVCAGATLFLSVYGLHRNPRIWKDPDKFDPERFGINALRKPGKYEYLPFGVGNHTCLGQHLAMKMMVLFIARFVQLFEFNFDENTYHVVPYSTLKPSANFNITINQINR